MRILTLVILSPPDTSDIAQVTTYDVPLTVEVKSGITCSLLAMYARIARWKARKAEHTDADVADSVCIVLVLTHGLLPN